MERVLIAAVAAAFLAAGFASPAAAQQNDERNLLIPLVLGTTNVIVNPPWGKTSWLTFHKVKVVKYFKYGRYHFKKVKFKTVAQTNSRGLWLDYVQGAVFCSALTPIIKVALERRELSNQEVIDDTISCFFPPYALIRLINPAPGPF